MAAQAFAQALRGLFFAFFYGAVRWLWRPELVNTHAIMYALVAESPGSNTLELFHPLWVPALKLLAASRRALGFEGNALMLFELFCLAGAVAHLFLLHRLALKTLKDETLAFAAALVATASINLWAWSTQTMPYTWATAAILAVFCELVEPGEWTRRRSARMGLLTGVAMGLDTAAVALIPAAAVEWWTRKGQRRKFVPIFSYALTLAITVVACYAPYLAIGRELPRGFGEMLANLPPDIRTLYATKSVAAQFKVWAASTAPKDYPWFALAALWYYAWLRRRSEDGPLVRSSLVFAGGVLVFFLVNDPHNRFLYAAGLTTPVLAAWAVRRRKKPELWLLGLWAALIAKNAAFPADYLPKENLGFSEARFVRASLGANDLLASFSEPDWLFMYALEAAVPVVRAGPGLNEAARRTLCAGGKVWLASDSLFRDPSVKPGDDKRLLDSLRGTLRLGEAVVSPSDQHYYPLSVVKPCRPRPRRERRQRPPRGEPGTPRRT